MLAAVSGVSDRLGLALIELGGPGCLSGDAINGGKANILAPTLMACSLEPRWYP